MAKFTSTTSQKAFNGTCRSRLRTLPIRKRRPFNRGCPAAGCNYTQLDVTLGRVGAASTVTDQPDHLEIVDVIRDDMFTVLFQKNGVRYVVSALPEQEAWLTEILKTWQFTD